MAEFVDEVLGLIKVQNNPLSQSIRMRLSPRGEIVVSAPKRTPLALIKKAVRDARNELENIKNSANIEKYYNSQQIGHSHKLVVVSSDVSTEPRVKLQDRLLVVYLPKDISITEPSIQNMIRQDVTKILRKEAKAYLPKRLNTLANRFGYSYQAIRFPHTISRWGSCSSRGTISLNIALMKLPLDLIDYVIIHELTHTIHMNHSTDFWRDVERHDPEFRSHRKLMKQHSPII